MRDERFRSVLGRLDGVPRPADEEIGERIWERIEPALLVDAQVESTDEPTGAIVDLGERRDRGQWWRRRVPALVAAAATVIVLAVVMTTGGGGDSEIGPADSTPAPPAPDPTVETTRPPSTSTVDTPTSASVRTTLDADLAIQVEFGPDGTPWAVVDPPGPESWAIVRRDGEVWQTIASEHDESSPVFESGSRRSPSIVGVHPDGSLWVHEMVGRPEGPFRLWELDGGRWTDHSETGLGGAAEFGMACCGVSMAPDGTVWTSMGAGESSVVRRYDGSGWEAVPELTIDEAQERAGEPGFPTFMPHVIDRLDIDAADADPDCLGRAGAAGYDLDDPDVMRAALRQATLASAVGPDGAVWHAVVCIGVVRFDPADETTAVFTFDSFLDDQLVTDLAVAPDGTIWITGDGGIIRVDFDDTTLEDEPDDDLTDRQERDAS